LRVQGKKLEFDHNYNARSRALMYDFFNKHFRLGFSAAALVEQDYEPLSPSEASVWSGNFTDCRPATDEDAECDLLRALDSTLAKLPSLDAGEGDKWLEVMGGWLDAVIGRAVLTPAQVAARTEKLHALMTEAAKAASTAEGGRAAVALPVSVPTANGRATPTAVADCTLTLSGSRHTATGVCGDVIVVVGGDQHTIAAILQQAPPGTACLNLALLGGASLTLTPVVDNPREVAAYTLGYNLCLFSHRVHDVLAAIAAAHTICGDDSAVKLVGTGATCGVLAAAAAAACASGGGGSTANDLAVVAVDTGGFRFQTLTSIRDPNLLPGAVRYGDVPALLAVTATKTPLLLVGTGEPAVPPLVASAHSALGWDVGVPAPRMVASDEWAATLFDAGNTANAAPKL
jgi:hypothetical protein